MSLLDDDLRGLASLLTTTRLGRVHEHHASVASTNDRSLAWLSEVEPGREGSGSERGQAQVGSGAAPDGALVTADAQTAGRGRLGRRWSSPPGRDVYASVIVRPGVAPTGFGAVSLAVAVGLREGLISLFGEPLASRLALKWPNDLLLDGRKLAGILCESRWRGHEVELVIGFGINVHRERDEFEPDLRARATSLALELAPEHRRGRAAILASVLTELERSLDRFFAEPGGFAAIRSRYEPHCLVIGQTIEVAEPSGRRFMAIAESLDQDGALRVRPSEGGPSVRVESADVWLQAEPLE